jgi:putative ABC transport system ATP-binding protein
MLKLEHISKVYQGAGVQTAALDDISLEVPRGQFLAIMGPSGCGKSTLLNILGLIDSPTQGSYWFKGEDIARHSEEELTLRRRADVGFVFQNFNLIDDLTVAQNVDISLIYRGVSGTERKHRVAEALERVGLSHRTRHMPRQLSGGQQQRVAVARALVAGPAVILADEPTGNLDTANGEAIMEMLVDAAQAGTTIVMVTHSETHAARAHRVVGMLDGRFVDLTEL